MRFTSWKGMCSAGLAAVTALGLAACSSSGSSGGSNKSTYTIGVTAGLSGAVGGGLILFKAAVAGLQSSLDAVNAAGGVNGHKIELDVQNDAADPSTASQQYRTFVANGDIAILSDTLSTISGPLFDRASHDKIPIFGISLINTTPIQPYVFGMDVPGDQSVSVEAPFLKQLLTASSTPRIGLVTGTSAAGVAEKAAFPGDAADNGLQVVTSQVQPVPLVDFSTQTAHIAAAKVDAIATNADASNGPIIMKSLANAGVNVPTVGYWAAGSLATFKEIDNPNWYAYYDYTDPSLSSQPGVAQMIKDAKAAHQDVGSSAEVSGYYLLGRYLAAALKKCSSTCSRSDLKTNLEHTTIPTDGLASAVGFTPTSHTFAKSVRFYRYVDGNLTSSGSAVAVK